MRTTVVGKTRTESPHFIIYYEPEQVSLTPPESPVEMKVWVAYAKGVVVVGQRIWPIQSVYKN